MATPRKKTPTLTAAAELRALGEETAAKRMADSADRPRISAVALKELRDNLARAQGAVQSAMQDSDSLRAQNRGLQRQVEGKDLHIKDLERALERAQNDHQMQASNAGAFQRQYGDTLRRLEGVLDLIAHEPGEVTRITKGRS